MLWMPRLAFHLSRRLVAGSLYALTILLALIGVIEIFTGTLDFGDLWRSLAQIGLNASSWLLDILPVGVLVGCMLTLSSMQEHRELIVMKATGLSVWRLAAAPAAAMIIFGVIVSFLVDPLVIAGQRSLDASRQSAKEESAIPSGGEHWLGLEDGDARFHIRAMGMSRDGKTLGQTSVYSVEESGFPGPLFTARYATLENNHWVLHDGTQNSRLGETAPFDELILPGFVSVERVRLAQGAGRSMSYFEIMRQLRIGELGDTQRAVAQMRVSRLEALPLLLVGALLIAFAVTAGYRRTGTPGVNILHGILLGFVVYVLTSLADRAGSAGVLDTAFAAWGPAILSIVIGVTVLLYVEDG